MSHHTLRKDKICQNCGYTVDQRYCSKCGQENTDSRLSFRELVSHFIEDLTHYEGRFWSTLKYLFTRPAYLTQQYLSGKRNSFVPPVRLYIFVSFITFFLPHILPDSPEEEGNAAARPISGPNVNGTINGDTFSLGLGNHPPIIEGPYKTLKELDSVQTSSPDSAKFSWYTYLYFKKAVELKKYSRTELGNKFQNAISSNFPKALFLYLPLFAFVIGVFHKRRNWFYSDHAIFTLHFFSFILITFSFFLLFSTTIDWIFYQSSAKTLITGSCLVGLLFWYVYYFFRAHHKMYGEKRFISVMKAWSIFIINNILFVILLVGLVIITLLMLH